MITKEQERIINKLYEDLHCQSIYIVGSQVAPFISNKNDLDIVLIDDNFIELKKIITRHQLRIDYNIDIHLCSQDFFINHAHWSHPFCILYKGKEQPIKDILTNIDFVKRDLTNRLNMLKQLKERKIFYQLKEWYHFYAILCYLENNSYVLTKEQIKNIDILRSKNNDLDIKKYLIEKIIQEVELWQL